MRNSLIIFAGLVFLGISLIISSSKISDALRDNLVTLNGSISLNNKDVNTEIIDEREFLSIGDVSSILGYENISDFTSDVLKGKMKGLPYINVDGKLIFSRTTFEQWLIDSSEQHVSTE